MTSPKVQYAYASGSANHIRPTFLTYPSGRELNYNYGSADSMPDAASRLAALLDDDGSTHLADYSYLGRGSFVETDYTEPEVKYTLVGTAGGDDPDTGDIYRGLDRFGRIKDSYWRDYGGSADVDRIKYGYDRNGNRTYRENPVATANSAYFDEKYFHDLLDRLKHMDRGRLNGPKDAVTNKTFAQCWSLDATGNWRKFTEDSDGDGVWDLDQLRTSNRVNEITDLSEYTGASWVTPAYNRAGNMTTIPKPADPTASFTGTYDAWNRLVKLEDGSGTVARYEYDGAKRRTVKKSYTGGTLTETRHLFYTEPAKWQVIEERVDSETDPDRQFVWGPRYIDDLVLRDRDTDADGELDERLYGMQDANWNVTGIVDSSGDVQERYSYTAYGQSTALTAAFGYRGGSNHQWEGRFAGYRLDLGQGTYWARNRVLSPALGTWLLRDPLGYSDMSSSLYAYVGNSPTNNFDPYGLQYRDPRIPMQVCGSVPRATDNLLEWQRLQDMRACLEWALRQTGTGWLIGLPDCPCTLLLVNGSPINPNGTIWHNPTVWLWTYHPGAKWCMRSRRIRTRSGQQCCYDADGILITEGESAGTPDRVSPDYYGLDTSHSHEDVIPFDKCKGAGMLHIYFNHRPPNKGQCRTQAFPYYWPIPM